jgi:glycosyltransferase involved in cell wall biosynthesis
MRILYIIPELHLGGTERQLMILACQMRELGHTVRILAIRPSRRPFPVDPGIDVRVLCAPPPHNMRCLWFFMREIRRFRPDVVQTFLFGFDLWANLAARLLGVPCIVSARRELATWQTRWHRLWQGAGNLFADAVVANSLAAAEYACSHESFLNSGRMHAIPNAFSLPFDPPDERQELPQACGKTMVYVANFWPGKGHDILLRAFAVLCGKASASLWLVGEGDRRQTLQDLAGTLGLRDRVHFLGRRDNVAGVLARADLYVHASTMESSPNAILEAMGKGVPVVAFACGGVPELLDGGDLGLLVNPGNEKELAGAMSLALDRPGQCSSIAARAQAVVRERHDPRVIARQYEDVYAEASRRSPARSSGEVGLGKRVALYTVGDLGQPSTRYRVLQYIPGLQSAGYSVKHFSLPTPGSRRFVSTAWLFFHLLLRRYQLRQARLFGHVLVQKALTPSRWRGMLGLLGRNAVSCAYDLDDDVLGGAGCLPFRGLMGRLQNPGEAVSLVKSATAVIAGNEFLAESSARHGGHAVVIPTVLDCRRYWYSEVSGLRQDGAPLRLVWVGQRSTLPMLEDIIPALRQAAEALKDRGGLVLRIVCDRFPDIDPRDVGPLGMELVPWNLDTEVQDLVGSHIGLMPLRDDSWCLGKCGFKAVQYMALGIAPIVSPVGVNARIVEHGICGYHARGTEDWAQLIEALAVDETMRLAMGRRARERIVAGYSLRRWQEEWIRQVTGGGM